MADATHFTASLPTKRMGADCLFTDLEEAERLLDDELFTRVCSRTERPDIGITGVPGKRPTGIDWDVTMLCPDALSA